MRHSTEINFARPMWTIAPMLAAALAIAAPLCAQQESQKGHVRYILKDLGTLGGPNSYQSAAAPSLNNHSMAVGAADTLIPDPYAPNCFSADCLVTHAFRWQDGVLTGLGALSRVDSSFPNWINESGLTVGISENGRIDALTGFPQFQAVLWNKEGALRSLGNLGGDESQALAVNNSGQIVGTGTNALPDAYAVNCFYPMGTQMRGLLWHNGAMRDLGTLGGNDTCAFLINEAGQISGFSYTNTVANPATGVPTQVPFLYQHGKMESLGTLGGTFGIPNFLNNHGQIVGNSNVAGDSAYHPFLWQTGKMVDLGTLGGSFGNATWITEAGSVVGWANPAGDTGVHAFLWKHGVMADLGALDSDVCSFAQAINSTGQIVGGSGDCAAVERPFVWQHGGPMLDLNSLAFSRSGLVVQDVTFINDRGEIYGFGMLPNGDQRVVVLIPCDANHPYMQDCDAAPNPPLNMSYRSSRWTLLRTRLTRHYPQP